MPEPTLYCRARGDYCMCCDLLVGLPGLHVLAAERDDHDRLVVTVESAPEPMGCRSCGVIARGHGRIEVSLVDAPAFGRPVRIIWRERRWLCPDPACEVGSFVEQDEKVAAPRAVLTTWACRWAIEQIRREHASVNGIRRQHGTGWRTVWDSIQPLLQAADEDPSRFEGVAILGVDEHVWHHVSTKPIHHGGRGPKELTGMVDLTRDEGGRTRARLLDLVPGRSGRVYKDWLDQRGDAFRARIEVATLDPFHGYKNAIDDQLEDARSVLDTFHMVNLATTVVDDVRRRVQQQIHGTAAARAIRCTGSATSCAPARRISPIGNAIGSRRPGPLTSNTSRSKSRGCAPRRFAPPTVRALMPPGEQSPRRSSPPSPRARSPRSHGWARP